MPRDYSYTAKSYPNIPEHFLPAGKVFVHGGGKFSTHLNTVVEMPDEKGGYAFIPMLVPGQQDIGQLLAGERATPEQMRIAVTHALKKNPPRYGSIKDALAAEQSWRAANIPIISDYIQQADVEQGAAAP